MRGLTGSRSTGQAPLRLDLKSGIIQGARYLASANCDQRPAGTAIDTLVIHSISLPPGEYGGGYVESLFTNRLPTGRHPYLDAIAELRVSSHFFIGRTGDLTQFVPTRLRAWHAGVSHCLGRVRVNDFSIGIELEGDDDHDYEDSQYQCLIALSKELMVCYPAITVDRIFGHLHIAPERKTDPGPCFDWLRYLRACKGRPGAAPPQD